MNDSQHSAEFIQDDGDKPEVKVEVFDFAKNSEDVDFGMDVPRPAKRNKVTGGQTKKQFLKETGIKLARGLAFAILLGLVLAGIFKIIKLIRG